MDLLDSIMSKMTKPPSVNDKQKKLLKEQQKAFNDARNAEREQLSKFRKEVEQQIHGFMQDNSLEKLRLAPMEQVARSVVRDVADVAGLTTYTFGVEGEDRHVMLFKKDYPLDERELQAYRAGQDWDQASADKLTAQLVEDQRQDEFETRLLEQQRRQQLRLEQKGCGADGYPIDGGPKFVAKIDRLVGGRQTGKQAAKSMDVDDDRQFGFVPCLLKKDKRTIEETLADIKAKKLKRCEAEQQRLLEQQQEEEQQTKEQEQRTKEQQQVLEDEEVEGHHEQDSHISVERKRSRDSPLC